MNKLENLAMRMNELLDAAGRNERWEIDVDASSNSVGTWFCGTFGGVLDDDIMRGETARLIHTPSLSRNQFAWFNKSLKT